MMGSALTSYFKKMRSRFAATIHNLLFKYRIADQEQERIDSELGVARKIQFSLVPNAFPLPPIFSPD